MVQKGVKCKLTIVLLVVFLFACLLNSCSANKAEADQTANTSITETTKVMTAASSDTSTTSKPADKLDRDKAKEVLIEFLTADSIHLKCLVTYTRYDSSPVDPKTFEVWSKGDKYRSDEYERDKIKLIVIAVDDSATQYGTSSKKSTEALWPAKTYTDYYKWDVSMLDDGMMDLRGSYYIFTIDGIDTFYKKDSAQAGYYQTKLEFGVDNEKVIYLTLYGNSSYGEKPSGVNAVTQTYEFVKINEDFSNTVFDDPF